MAITTMQKHHFRSCLLVLLLMCGVRAITAQDMHNQVRLIPLNITGTWESLQWSLDSWILDLKSSGTTLTGKVWVSSVSAVPASTDAHKMEIYDGTIDKIGFAFKVKSPDGMRVIAYSGTYQGGSLKLSRKVEMLQVGASPGGADIFGAAGPSSFIVTRVKTPDRRARHIDQ